MAGSSLLAMSGAKAQSKVLLPGQSYMGARLMQRNNEGLDRVQKRLEEIMPHGRGATILPERLLPEQPVAMAMDGQKLYVAGRSCQCVVAIDLFGTRDATILVEDAGLISAMAAGGEWLVVADSRDKIMRIYRQGALVGEPDYQTLKLMDPRGMAISNQTLYIADALARRIVTFRMRS
jgi:hypothetical protein